MATAFNPSDLTDTFLMHADTLPAVGANVDTPSGSWVDVSKYEYVMAIAVENDLIASQTALLIKVQESDANTGASPVDVTTVINSTTTADFTNKGQVKEIRTHGRKKFFGVLANQTGGAAGQQISILLIGIRAQYIPSDMTAFASQPTIKGPLT